MNEKPNKRRYHSKGCARCQGQGVVVLYERKFLERWRHGVAMRMRNRTP